jgi:hypothetical protein
MLLLASMFSLKYAYLAVHASRMNMYDAVTLDGSGVKMKPILVHWSFFSEKSNWKRDADHVMV